MHDDSLLYQAAELYFVQDMTMGAVAERLGVSRSTVSRMLADAKARGIVTITLRPPDTPTDRLSRRIHDTFRVTAHIAGTQRASHSGQRLDAVSRYTAQLLASWVQDGTSLGVAWGTTTSAIASHVRHTNTQDVSVVQLNGAAGPRTAGTDTSAPLLSTLAQAFNAELYPFPTPAFFDWEQTRTLLWQESSVRRILAARASVDLAVFSVGAFRGPMISQVYTSGYLPEDALRELSAHRVVGDVCTVFLREDGTYADIDYNRRASGPTPMELRRIPRRLCVVAGDHKVPGVVGALRAGVVTDLLIDERTAASVVRHLFGR